MANLRNIALTGFMGSGKSAVSKTLGKLTGYHVVDVDSEVQKQAGKTIQEIFDSEGEQAFRDMESRAVARIAEGASQIISTGGGVVLRQENMDALRTGGVIVNLQVSAETVHERTRHCSHRPLLQVKNPLERIRQMMAEREEFYRNADIVIDTDDMSVMQVAEEILESIEWNH